MVSTLEEELLESIDIDEFLEFAGIRMRKGKNVYRGKCPIHMGDNETSFVYVKKENYFYCHSRCKRVGSFVDVYAKTRGISKKQALLELAYWKRISVEEKMFSARKKERKKERLIRSKTIKEEKVAIHRLPEIPEEEKMGLVPMYPNARFPKEIVERFGILKGIYGRYKNRIVFPVYDHENKWVGNNGRWIGENYQEEGVPKYLSSPYPFETRYLLYGYHLAKNFPFWIIHEGVMDVIQAYRHGYCAVASFGSHLTDEQIDLIRMNPKPVVLGFDGDEAGRAAAVQAVRALLDKHFPLVEIMLIPDGRDPGDSAKEEYDSWFRSRIPAVQFLANYTE